MDTTALQTAYEALQSYLSGQQLYQDAPTKAFDRAELSRLFTAYYDAEAQTLREIGEARGYTMASSALDEMAQSIGYDNYSQMASGATIIEGGKIRTDLIDTKKLKAEVVEVSDASGGLVSIKPGNGLKLMQDGAVTATFSGAKIGKLDTKIAQNANIYLTETLLSETRLNAPTQTVTLASGNISIVGAKIAVDIPAITLIMKASYRQYAGRAVQAVVGDDLSDKSRIIDAGPVIIPPIWPVEKPNPSPITIWAELWVNGIRKTRISECLDTFIYDRDYVAEGPQSYYYTLNKSFYANMPAWKIEYANSGKLNIELRYGLSSPSPGLIPGEWLLKVAARRPGTPIDSMPLIREPIVVGGAVFNAAFFGNGLLFSQSTTQYVGLATPSGDNAELIVRSNQNGFRCDGSGQSRWCNQRQEWIPVDRVLYRGYINPSGYKVKVWAYDGRAAELLPSRYAVGCFKVILPNTKLRPFTDFVVRVDAWTTMINDKRQATVYYGENSNWFNVTLSNGDYYDGSFFFEVVDVSDMS